MYFIINHYGEKASFKNPFNIEKYTPEEKANRFKKINASNSEQSFEKSK